MSNSCVECGEAIDHFDCEEIADCRVERSGEVSVSYTYLDTIRNFRCPFCGEHVTKYRALSILGLREDALYEEDAR